MSEVELVEIVDKGLAKAGMTIDPAVKKSIASLSQGLPPCTHLLARHAALVAVDSERTEITQSDLNQAVSDAVANQQQSIVNAYEKATHSPKSLLKISFARCVDHSQPRGGHAPAAHASCGVSGGGADAL